MSLYKIIFEDNSTFLGGNLEQPKWLEIPDKKIKKLIYRLPNGKKIILENQDAYYHFIEVCYDIMGRKKGQKQLEYAYLIAKKDTTYKMYKIDLRTKQIETKILDELNEWINSLNPIGWKKGI